MMSHDPLCPVMPYSNASGLVRGLCLCPEFAKVRADERDKIEKRKSAIWSDAVYAAFDERQSVVEDFQELLKQYSGSNQVPIDEIVKVLERR